jgi:hypothetical protein
MSLIILHGEHHVNSRAKLVEFIAAAQQKNAQIEHLEAGSSLNAATLEAALGSQDMFVSDKLVIVEGLLTSQRSKKKDEMLDLLLKYADSAEIIAWEAKKLTAPQLKKFAKTKQELFTLSSSLFEWLDSLHQPIPRKLSLLQQAANQDGAEFCFAMLARQIRLLLLTKSGAQMKEHPFVVKKLQAQAKSFTLEKLVSLHEQLTFIDFRQKTGRSKLNLQQEMEQLLLK